MNAQEFFLANGTGTGIFICGKCGLNRGTQQYAEACCLCRYCNEPLDRQKDGTVHHYACYQRAEAKRDQERMDKAEKLEDWDGFVYCEGYGREGYCESVEELREEIEDEGDELPEWVFVCKEIPFKGVDVSDIIERVTEEMYDDAADDLKGVPELTAAIEAFNQANAGMITYYPDYTRAVRLRPAETAAVPEEDVRYYKGGPNDD